MTVLPPWLTKKAEIPSSVLAVLSGRDAKRVVPPWEQPQRARVKAISEALLAKTKDFAYMLQVSDSSDATKDPQRLLAMIAVAMLTNFGMTPDGADSHYPLSVLEPMPAEGCPGGAYSMVQMPSGNYCLKMYNSKEGAEKYLSDMESLRAVLDSRDVGSLASAIGAFLAFANASDADRKRALEASFQLASEALGTPSEWQGGDGSLGGVGVTSTLPTNGVERIKAALELIQAPYKELTGNDITQGIALAFVALASAISNFGLYTFDKGGTYEQQETNNWLKLGVYDVKDASACPAGSVFFVDGYDKSQRCLYLFASPAEGAKYALTSLMLSERTKAAIAGSDIGKLAEALLRDGYLYPMGFDDKNFASVEFLLQGKIAEVAQIGGLTNDWKITDYKPGSDGAGETPVPPQTPPPDNAGDAGADKKGLSTGAKWAIGVGVVGVVGLAWWGMSKSGGAQRVANPLAQNPHYDDETRRIAQVIWDLARPSDQGKKVFYTQEEWKAKEGAKAHGAKAKLVVVYDCGDEIGRFFDFDCGRIEQIEQMQEALRRIGYYAENINNWSAAIYPISKSRSKSKATEREILEANTVLSDPGFASSMERWNALSREADRLGLRGKDAADFIARGMQGRLAGMQHQTIRWDASGFACKGGQGLKPLRP